MSDVTRVEAIYLAAVERADPDDRAAYLDSACGGDPALRRLVDQLLAAHPKLGRFLEPPNDLTRDHHPVPNDAASKAGAVVGGRYKLLERIGEGGMGEVWMAEQTEPVKRRVAVKLIKAGMDTRTVLSRFAAERQALAVMDHPHIARVLDAGTTDDGRPYFVMELVKGVPITEFCDARRLTPRERLDLFIPVCQAIQHAHQKGVIHRDVKPSNVLVELHDDRPVPKVIDFGVAKAVGQPLTEETLFTGFGALVGTPAYMAPEQATFNALDIDTRADVYALGVLLYELLAGSPPVEGERLRKAALEEVLRLVREEEPPRPSQRLSTSQARASIAAVRGAEPDRLSALLRGELDWIVMKALEKDRGRRYESATALARDVQRYLAGDAVEACPPTLGYRLRKAYRRNQAALVAGTGFLLMLLLGVTAASVLAIRAQRAEALARDRAREALRQASIAEENRDRSAKLSTAYHQAMMEARVRAASSRIDADLLEYKNDPRLGLLRLAQPLDTGAPWMSLGLHPDGGRTRNAGDIEGIPEFVKLREFQAAAVLTAGQDFAPLVPPFAKRIHDLGPDGRLGIAGDERDGLRLVAIPTLAEKAVLREGTERLLQWGFSPDGTAVFTQDTDGVARFWNRDGTLRAKTPLRADRCIYPEGVTMDQLRSFILPQGDFQRLIVAGDVAIVQSTSVDWAPKKDSPGDANAPRTEATNLRGSPVELVDTRTGRLLRRATAPGRTWTRLELFPELTWIVAVEVDSDEHGNPRPAPRDPRVVILSSTDGTELARLGFAGEPTGRCKFVVHPQGRWVLTLNPKYDDFWKIVPEGVRLYRGTDWQAVADPRLTQAIRNLPDAIDLHFTADDWVAVQTGPNNPDLFVGGWIRLGHPESWRDSRPPNAFLSELPAVEHVPGERTVFRWRTDLFTTDTIERLRPPPGRKYHPFLSKLAPDGRFWSDGRFEFHQSDSQANFFYGAGQTFRFQQQHVFAARFWYGDQFGHELDTATEKELPFAVDGPYLPGFGRVALRTYGESAEDRPRKDDPTELRVLPDPARLDLPPELVHRWAQVLVGGELGPDGRFVAWDQPTWEGKQRELAAAKPPYPDFPFPGWPAAEPNLWYRIRANEQPPNSPEHHRLITEWRRRTGRMASDPGPDPWRTPRVSPPATE